MSESNRSRSYCFTLNNYTEEEIDFIKQTDCKYLVFGKEVGEKNGTPHLQGFVSFNSARTMKGIHKDLGWERTALKPSRKPLSAIDYCKKGEQSHEEWEEWGVKGENYGKNADFFEMGKYEQGARNDLRRAYEAVKEGKSVDDVAWDDPSSYNAASKTLMKLEDVRLRKMRRTEMTEGIWVYGGTGVGKSTWAFEQGGDSFYVYPYDSEWWDAYKCEDCVIIDEFRGQIPYDTVLRMVDEHPNFFVRRRCREPMPFVSKKVIITSSLPPWKVFKNRDQQDSLKQIFRRFKIYEKTANETRLIDEEEYIDELDI